MSFNMKLYSTNKFISTKWKFTFDYLLVVITYLDFSAFYSQRHERVPPVHTLKADFISAALIKFQDLNRIWGSHHSRAIKTTLDERIQIAAPFRSEA